MSDVKSPQQSPKQSPMEKRKSGSSVLANLLGLGEKRKSKSNLTETEKHKSGGFESDDSQTLSQLIMEKKSQEELEHLENVLMGMKLSSGDSVGEMSKKHRLIIFTIKWLGCPLCQELIEHVSEQLLPMLHLNTIPVIGTQEDSTRVKKYFESSTNPAVKNLLSTGFTKESRTAFGLHNASLGNHFKTMGKNMSAMLYEGRYFSAPLDVISPLTAFGVFVIENASITKKIIYDDLTKRINFGLFLQDLKFFSNSSQEKDSSVVLNLIKLYPKMDSRALRRVTKVLSQKLTEGQTDDISEGISRIEEMNALLGDEKKRYFFKAFAINERSSESICFYEDVATYRLVKDEQREKKSNVIFQIYLDQDSIGCINTSKNLTDEVKARMDQKDFASDLFDVVLKDLIVCTMLDTFTRFKDSSFYQQMKSEKQNVISYLC